MTEIFQPPTTPEAWGPLTPAGISPLQVLNWRRAFFVAMTSLTFAILSWTLARGLGLGAAGQTWRIAETLVFAFSLLAMPWGIIGFWNALIGLWLLHGHRDGLAAAAPFWREAGSSEPLSFRVAVIMTVRNEDPDRAMARLRAVRLSLDALSDRTSFDYFLLSDTSDAAIASREEVLCEKWRQTFGADARLVYRRRVVNEGFKAGNIRDFLNEHGQGYELMAALDADSVMSGETLIKMCRVMQRFPRLGILQSLIVGTPSASAFARIFQFGMRNSMRTFTMGSAWWAADCGPYWGHNALVRIAPFKGYCKLPILPGKPPFGGHVLSHDQIEAAYMRRGGFEVRVVPEEGGSYEDNPPTLLDFLIRDTRWCQGNLQYGRFLIEQGLQTLSRAQIALAIVMYLGSIAWAFAIIAAAIGVMVSGFSAVNPAALATAIIALVIMNLTPKIAGVANVLCTAGGAVRYGGVTRLLAGAVLETAVSLLISPIVTFNSVIFTVSLLLGRTVVWSGQARDVRGLSWETAAHRLWPQTLAGLLLFGVVAVFAKGALLYSLPICLGLVLAIPLGVVTASPALGRFLASIKICAGPEEIEATAILTSIAGGGASPPLLVGLAHEA